MEVALIFFVYFKLPQVLAVLKSCLAALTTTRVSKVWSRLINPPDPGRKCVSWWTHHSHPHGGAPLSQSRNQPSWRSCGCERLGICPPIGWFNLVWHPGTDRHHCLWSNLAETRVAPVSTVDRCPHTIQRLMYGRTPSEFLNKVHPEPLNCPVVSNVLFQLFNITFLYL